MGGGNLSPRQQMISLMYLVLLAMLAMNASKSLLNAFVALEHGIDKTVGSFDATNGTYYSTIAKAAGTGEASFVAKEQLVNKLKAKADAAVSLMENQKVALVTQGAVTSTADTSGGALKEFYDDKGIPLAKDNQDYGASYFMVIEGGKAGEELKRVVDEFRDLAIQILKDEIGGSEADRLISRYEDLLDTKKKKDPVAPSDPPLEFAQRIAEHLPLAAVTANLSLYESYIRNAEADIVGAIAARLEGNGMVVNKAEGMAIFESGYVLKGDSVKARVFTAAYNDKITPTVIMGEPDTAKFNENKGTVFYPAGEEGEIPLMSLEDTTHLPIVNGKGMFKIKSSTTGEGNIKGVIKVQSAKGTYYYPFDNKYMVAEPTATVAATAMNVFYVGIPNPVQISAPGVSMEDLDIRGSSGITVTPKNKARGEYEVMASKPSPGVKILVNKKSGAKLGEAEFRCKPLPTPVAKILGKSEGLISTGELKVASFIKADMENFVFDLRVEVVSFDMVMSVNGDLVTKSSNSQMLTSDMKALLSRAARGSRLYFENIKAKMPNGERRNLGSISLKVK